MDPRRARGFTTEDEFAPPSRGFSRGGGGDEPRRDQSSRVRGLCVARANVCPVGKKSRRQLGFFESVITKVKNVTIKGGKTRKKTSQPINAAHSRDLRTHFRHFISHFKIFLLRIQLLEIYAKKIH